MDLRKAREKRELDTGVNIREHSESGGREIKG